MRWITWQDSTVATLTAAANDGTGPWSVGPHKPADDPAAGVEWAAGKTLAAATRKGLDLVAKRLAQDLARDVDPTGPGGFAGPSLIEPELPELSAAGDHWRHDS